MQNIIKHKRISSLAILIILVIVFAISIDKSAAAGYIVIGEVKSKPIKVLSDEWLRVIASNSMCSKPARATIKVVNAENGKQVGTSSLENIAPRTRAIKSFFYPAGPGESLNIVATIVFQCPENSLILNLSIGWESAIIEIVDSNNGSTIRRIDPSFITFTAPGDVAG